MNTNAVADEVLEYLSTKHARVYRNRAPQSPTFPYVVFRVESVLNNSPSEDFYINVDIYEDVSKSVRTIEDLADTIDAGLNMTVINTSVLNMHFLREARQFIDDEELVGKQMINLRYNTRIYFK
jgi:hypothetical protein